MHTALLFVRRIWLRALVVPLLVTVALAGLVVSPASAAKRAFCGQPWGSNVKQFGNNDPGALALLTGLSASTNPCFDRLVFNLTAPVTSYRVEYVPVVTQDGSGDPVPLRGGAFLMIVMGAAAHDLDGRLTFRAPNRKEAVNVQGFTTFRQVATAGDFEGLVTTGLGVRARLPFRVFVLPGPGSRSRLVVDVSHRWI